MPDVFADINAAPDEMLDIIMGILEARAAIPAQRAMLHDYLSDITFRDNAKVLEVGCGTGPVARVIAQWPNVGQVIGVDPSPKFLAKAQELADGISGLEFEEGDGTALRFEDEAFDVVILHTLLSHIPEPEGVLAEAHRVLKPDGILGWCDGDFSTASVALGDDDPLEACVTATIKNIAHDKWMVRRIQPMLKAAGFKVGALKCYGLMETEDPGVTMSWIERGADALVAQEMIGPDLANALKAEANRRAECGTFFGYMGYASMIARK
jgi:ubiquinone/menaquinone biosynthesis C-methylase UbiE